LLHPVGDTVNFMNIYSDDHNYAICHLYEEVFFFFFFFNIINLLCGARSQSTGANTRILYKIYMQEKPKCLCTETLSSIQPVSLCSFPIC
jgi:hypothetical protein